MLIQSKNNTFRASLSNLIQAKSNLSPLRILSLTLWNENCVNVTNMSIFILVKLKIKLEEYKL